MIFTSYVVLEARSVRKSGQQKNPAREDMDATKETFPSRVLPCVSILLPVYNEKLVVEKLIDAVCALQYPSTRLDILVLDDSTDETGERIATKVAFYRQKNIPIRHVRRENRTGFKAGNLSFGLTLAKGDFIAIFDADNVPPSDFLLNAMPCFEDEHVGFMQSSVDYANKNASFLTRFQAVVAEHKEVVTEGLAQDGFLASLTGSSCVWRKACIDSIGGISSDTITEDVDMGYKAQLVHSWKYVYLRNLVSLAELPETIGAFRVQRQRWARGLVLNALRHARHATDIHTHALHRLHAISLMFSSLLLASFYVLLLLSLPMVLVTHHLGLLFHGCCTTFLVAACIWVWHNISGGPPAQGTVLPLWKRAGDIFGYVIMFLPLSLCYFTAAVQVFAGIEGDFHSTPKGIGRQKYRHPPINTLLVGLEAFSLLYALTALYFSLIYSNFWVTLYSLIAACGFTLTLYLSWRDRMASIIPPTTC